MPSGGNAGGGDHLTAVARRLVAENPDHPTRGLARMLVKESNGSLTIEQARRRIARQLGRHGKVHRAKMKHTNRAPRLSGVDYRPPPTSAEPWRPHVLEVVGRVGIISDVHVPYHDEVAVRAAVRHLAKLRIDGLLLNGDIGDFYALSRWMKDPRQRDFSGELEAQRAFIAGIRKAFPGIPIVYKAGNHEERWQHYIWQHAPELSKDKLSSLQSWLHLDQHDITLVEDGRPVMLGELPVLHGHELQKGVAAPVNPARGAFLRTHHTTLVGHSHRSSSHAESDMWHAETTTWSTGCLCDLTPAYARINSWNHGFAVVTVHDDGQFDVENCRIAGGKVRAS